MDRELKRLIEQASQIRMTPEQEEEQLRSFAFGNGHFENPAITREFIDQVADETIEERMPHVRRR